MNRERRLPKFTFLSPVPIKEGDMIRLCGFNGCDGVYSVSRKEYNYEIHGVDVYLNKDDEDVDICANDDISKKIDWPALAKAEQERRLLDGGQFKHSHTEMIAESLIEHPKHYTQGIECADYVESHQMDFFQGNAVKYLTRFKHKGTPLDDLKKARWYVDRLIKKYSEND